MSDTAVGGCRVPRIGLYRAVGPAEMPASGNEMASNRLVGSHLTTAERLYCLQYAL